MSTVCRHADLSTSVGATRRAILNNSLHRGCVYHELSVCSNRRGSRSSFPFGDIGRAQFSAHSLDLCLCCLLDRKHPTKAQLPSFHHGATEDAGRVPAVNTFGGEGILLFLFLFSFHSIYSQCVGEMIQNVIFFNEMSSSSF